VELEGKLGSISSTLDLTKVASEREKERLMAGTDE
jgi:hypothetical protein